MPAQLKLDLPPHAGLDAWSARNGGVEETRARLLLSPLEMGWRLFMAGGKPVRVRVRYEGQVQGVGFRFTAQFVAGRFAVTGFVENLEDGSVQLVAEGAEAELLQFLQAVRASRVGRFILNEISDWGPATGEYAQFSIVSTW